MERAVSTIVILTIISAICSGKTLPDHVKPCSWSDPKLNKCLVDRCNAWFPQLANGDKEQHIPSLKPFILTKIEAVIDKMHLTLTNGKIAGFENLVVSSFDFNKEDCVMTISGTLPKMEVNSDYEVSGSLLILPIEGNGPFKMVLENLKVTVIVNVENCGKDSKKPIKILSIVLDYSYEDGKFQFENLFDDNKQLSEPINKLLKEEHQAINKQFKPVFLQAFNSIILSFIEPILKGYRCSDMFDD